MRGPRGRVPAAVGAVGGTVRDLVARVLVDPVRHGRIRTDGWPSGLAPVALLGALGMLAAVALVLLSGVLRAALPLAPVVAGSDALLPRSTVWVVFLLTGLALALAQVGAIHARPWVRWPVTALVVLVVLIPSIPEDGPLPIAKLVSAIAGAALLALVAIRSTTSFRWWEFAVVLGLIWGPAILSLSIIAGPARALGFDFGPILSSLILVTIAPLAIPSAIAAGSAMAELAISTGAWAAPTVRDRLGRVGMVVVALAAAVAVGFGLVGPAEAALEDLVTTGWELLGAAILLGALWGSWRLFERIRPAGGAPRRARVRDLLEELGPVALAIAAIMLAPTIVSTSGTLLGLVVNAFDPGNPAIVVLIGGADLLTSTVAITLSRALTAVGVLVAAVLLARRGRRTLPELLVAIALSALSFAAAGGLDIPFTWSGPSLTVVALLVGAVLLAIGAVRRRVGRAGATAGVVLLLVGALFLHRELIADPLAVLIGTAGAAVVLVGQLWSFFTDHASANEDSSGFPRPARVLLVIGWTLFALTALAFVSLARDPDAIVDLGTFGELGDVLFGQAIFAAVAVAALRAIAADEDPTSEDPAPDPPVE